MNDLEPAADRKLIYRFGPYPVRVEVGGYQDGLGSDLSHLAELVFCGEGLMLSPFLQIA